MNITYRKESGLFCLEAARSMMLLLAGLPVPSMWGDDQSCLLHLIRQEVKE